MTELQMSDDNDIIGRIKAIKFLRLLDNKMLKRADIAMKQGDYSVAQKYRASVAVNEDEIELLRNVGPKVKIFPSDVLIHILFIHKGAVV